MVDGILYKFDLGAGECEDVDQPRVRWWQLRSEPVQQPDLTSPGETLSPKVVYSLGMSRFKAVPQLEFPPRFEYRLSMQPPTLSLSDPTAFTVSVEVMLKEISTYTVYAQRLMDQPNTTVLRDRTNLLCFDLVDLDT